MTRGLPSHIFHLWAHNMDVSINRKWKGLKAVKYVTSIIIKFVMIAAVLLVVLGLFYGVSFAHIVWTSLVLTAVAYVLGDLFVLPFGGNMAATISDFALSFLTIWLIGAYFYDPYVPVVGAAFFSSLVIAVGEWFFHRYMNQQVLRDPERAES